MEHLDNCARNRSFRWIRQKSRRRVRQNPKALARYVSCAAMMKLGVDGGAGKETSSCQRRWWCSLLPSWQACTCSGWTLGRTGVGGVGKYLPAHLCLSVITQSQAIATGALKIVVEEGKVIFRLIKHVIFSRTDVT